MRRWLDPLLTAWVGVITHKLRAFLTILGIVIGVAAVIVLMSIGRGAEAQILSRIQSLGSNMVFISPGASFGFGGVRGMSGSATTLTMEDAAAIVDGVPNIKVVAPSYSSRLQLVAGRQNTNSQVTGITLDYLTAYNIKIASGSSISEYESQTGGKVALIGSGVVTDLFPNTDPVGQELRMGGRIFRVEGVMESKGAGFGSTDNAVLVPLTAMQQMVAQPKTNRGEKTVSSIAVAVTDETKSQQVVDDLTALLRSRHQLSDTASNDFTIQSMEEVAGTISETMGTMTLLLGAIAAISLLVGGIGVMNIMLVSVLERTREIGIRIALGARQRDIWTQFLIEAASLTFTGGIIGVALGWGASRIVGNLGTVPTLVTADIAVLAVSVSVGIGLFFGFYPAWNASRLNPIEALRAE